MSKGQQTQRRPLQTALPADDGVVQRLLCDFKLGWLSGYHTVKILGIWDKLEPRPGNIC